MKKYLFILVIVSILWCCNQEIVKSDSINDNTGYYTVQFDANGGSGTMTDVKVTNGDKYTLPEWKFTAPAGKKFAYWQTSYGGEAVKYAVKDKFEYKTQSSGGIIVFTAVWIEQGKHLITYHNYNPATKQSNFVEFSESDTVILDSVSQQYYEFNGWYDSAEGGQQVFGWRAGERTADVELWGKWTAQKFKIIYHNVEDVSNDNPTIFTIDDDVVLKDLSTDKFRFLGWYDSANYGNKVTGWNAGEKVEDVELWGMNHLISFNEIEQLFETLDPEQKNIDISIKKRTIY